MAHQHLAPLPSKLLLFYVQLALIAKTLPLLTHATRNVNVHKENSNSLFITSSIGVSKVIDFNSKTVAYKDHVLKSCYIEKIGTQSIWEPQRVLIIHPKQLTNQQVQTIAGPMVANFCYGWPSRVLRQPNNLEIRRKRSNQHYFVGRKPRGQTQSQYLNFGGNTNEPGKAEAESTHQGSKAIVYGTNGMGQAQSQSGPFSCADCYGGGAGEGGQLQALKPGPGFPTYLQASQEPGRFGTVQGGGGVPGTLTIRPGQQAGPEQGRITYTQPGPGTTGTQLGDSHRIQGPGRPGQGQIGTYQPTGTGTGSQTVFPGQSGYPGYSGATNGYQTDTTGTGTGVGTGRGSQQIHPGTTGGYYQPETGTGIQQGDLHRGQHPGIVLTGGQPGFPGQLDSRQPGTTTGIGTVTHPEYPGTTTGTGTETGQPGQAIPDSQLIYGPDGRVIGFGKLPSGAPGSLFQPETGIPGSGGRTGVIEGHLPSVPGQSTLTTPDGQRSYGQDAIQRPSGRPTQPGETERLFPGGTLPPGVSTQPGQTTYFIPGGSRPGAYLPGTGTGPTQQPGTTLISAPGQGAPGQGAPGQTLTSGGSAGGEQYVDQRHYGQFSGQLAGQYQPNVGQGSEFSGSFHGKYNAQGVTPGVVYHGTLPGDAGTTTGTQVGHGQTGTGLPTQGGPGAPGQFATYVPGAPGTTQTGTGTFPSQSLVGLQPGGQQIYYPGGSTPGSQTGTGTTLTGPGSSQYQPGTTGLTGVTPPGFVQRPEVGRSQQGLTAPGTGTGQGQYYPGTGPSAPGQFVQQVPEQTGSVYGPGGIQYPGGQVTGQYPAGQAPGQYQPGQTTQYPSGGQVTGQYPGGQITSQHPGSEQVTGQYPGSGQVTGQYPGSGQTTGQYPGRDQISGQYPGSGQTTAQYPGSSQITGQYPGSGQTTGQYPGGGQTTGHYPGSGQVTSLYPGHAPPGGSQQTYQQTPSGSGLGQTQTPGQLPGQIGGGQQYYPQGPAGQGQVQQPGGGTQIIGGDSRFGTQTQDGRGSDGRQGLQVPGALHARPGQYGPSGLGGTTGTGVAESDDGNTQAESSIHRVNNETQASASSNGHFGGGTAQSQVSGSYSGQGSFSASAGTNDGVRGAQTQVTGNKDGALSSSQGQGGKAQSQAQVQMASETGDTTSNAQTSGLNHGTNTQVQSGIKGGMADSQANGPGATSSQAQIGFMPYDATENEDEGPDNPHRGGGTASASSGTHAGKSQVQINGKYAFGIRYTGQAQASSANTGYTAEGINLPTLKPIDFSQTVSPSPIKHEKVTNAVRQRQVEEAKILQIVTTSTTPLPEVEDPSDSDYEDDYEDPEPEHTRNLVQQQQIRSLTHDILDPIGIEHPRGLHLKDGDIFNQGEYIPGTNGYQIPAGFRGRVSEEQQTHFTPSNTRRIYAVGAKTNRQHHTGYGAGYSYQPTYTPVQYGGFKSSNPHPKFVSVTKSETGSRNVVTGKKTPSVYYTQSSSCGFFTNTCVYSNGKKICFPKPKANPDGTPIVCRN